MKLPDIKAPSLPLPTQEYSSAQQDQFARALRLYFNTLDSDFNLLIAEAGMKWLSAPHITAQTDTNLYATADDTPTMLLLDTLDTEVGFTLNVDGSMTAEHSGIYRVDYSLQLANTDNTAHEVAVWLRVNGTDVVGSATKFSLAQRKSVGVYTYICAYSMVTFEVLAGESVSLYWATDKAYSTVGPVDGVYMPFLAAQTVPYARPTIPSAIAGITFVSRSTT